MRVCGILVISWAKRMFQMYVERESTKGITEGEKKTKQKIK